MTLRTRFILYLFLVHALMGGVAYVLVRQNVLWLPAVEIVFLISLAAGVALAKTAFRPVAFAREGARLIKEQEFTSRLRPVGQPELDDLIGVYNRMVDHLREERTRLREQHHFLSQILGVSPSGIVILDFDDRISEVNPAAQRLLGRPAVDLIGHRLDNLDIPLATSIAGLAAGETRVVGLTGARRLKCHRGRFLDRGFPRSFLSLEELTEELRQFERAAYEKLIRVMSHEVNNTVGASNSLLESSLSYAGGLPENSRRDFEDAIQIVIDRTDQLNRFMRTFADVFRLPAPARQPHDLVSILESIVRLLSVGGQPGRIAWRWEVAERGMRVAVDRGQIEQALLNILKNAAEAIEVSGGPGTVTIRVARRYDRPMVVVEDTGTGLTPEAQANLFTPFFSTKPGGQGIGLTLVQEVLSAHGFEYALESPPGGPTRFTVVF